MKKPKIVIRRSTMAMAAGGTLILAGCGTASAGAATNPGTTHQTITLWESHSAGGPPGLAVAALVKQFNATHPDIHVALTVTKASHKALGALAAGDAPVAAWISHYDGQFLSAHALVDLNSLINGPSGLTASERLSIFPVHLRNCSSNY